MGWYPLFLKMDGAPCLVVGGGKVALRKIVSLLESGALVTALAPQFDSAIEDLAARSDGQLTLKRAAYEKRDLAGLALVIAATDQRDTNELVAEDAQRAGVWVNVVDEPDLCTAQAAAVARRGALQIAINTGGACPALAAALRAEIEAAYPEWYAALAEALGRLRPWLLERCEDGATRKRVLSALVSAESRTRFSDLDGDALVEALKEELVRLLTQGA